MTYRYVLIDTCQRMRFFQSLNYWQAPYLSLFDGHPEEPFLDIAPLLVDVSDDNEVSQRVIEETENIGRLKPCVSRLESSLPLQELAEHLRQFHVVRMPDRSRLVLRWYDTSILPAWFDQLNKAQRCLFAKGITAWSYFNRFGDYQPLNINTVQGASSESVALPLELDEEQNAALWAHCEPDLQISELRKIIPKDIARVPYAALHPFISVQLHAAWQHGLKEQHDLTRYLLLGLYSSGQFVRHPQVMLRMSMTAHEHTQSFEDWVENTLPANFLSAFSPLWKTTKKHEETERYDK